MLSQGAVVPALHGTIPCAAPPSPAFAVPVAMTLACAGEAVRTARSAAAPSVDALQQRGSPDRSGPTELVILGSGVSTGLPRISCIIRADPCAPCAVCHDALDPASRNRRGNVSALVRAAGRTVLIDCGKTVRENAVRHFPTLGVRNVDAIALTHGHADAILGLDDARDIQEGAVRFVDAAGLEQWTRPRATPVYLNDETMAVCRNVFPYLMPADASPAEDEGAAACANGKKVTKKKKKKKDIPRRVAALEWNAYGEDEYFVPFRPVRDAPIELTPVPLLHGGDYVCMGFVIRVGDDADDAKTVAYLSDLHALPDRTRAFLGALPRIDLLVIDMLTKANMGSHLSREGAEEIVRELRPAQAIAVGMTCSLGLHDEVNGELARMESEEGLRFRLSYDGERFPLC